MSFPDFETSLEAPCHDEAEEREPWCPSWFQLSINDLKEYAPAERYVSSVSNHNISARYHDTAEDDYEEPDDPRHGLSKPGYNSYGPYWRKRTHRDSNEI